MKLLTSSALLGALCLSTMPANAATPAPIKPPAKTAIDKTAPPQDAYGVFTFDKAKAEADKKKRPLVFLVADERADDAGVKTAINRTYWTFWDDATVVLLHSSTANEWSRLPDPVQKAAKSADLGKGIPRLFAFDEDVTTPLLGMKSDQIIGKDEKALDKIAKGLKTANKTKTVSTEYPPPSLGEEAAARRRRPKPATAPATPASPGQTGRASRRHLRLRPPPLHRARACGSRRHSHQGRPAGKLDERSRPGHPGDFGRGRRGQSGVCHAKRGQSGIRHREIERCLQKTCRSPQSSEHSALT